MSADFWAGYISGAAGIILGNPLDVLKVRLQAGTSSPSVTAPSPAPPSPAGASSRIIRPFLLGTAAPVLGYGALNALLFVSYNRTEAFLNQLSGPGGDLDGGQGRGSNLLTCWIAGAVGGLATWVVSTPTELVKCRAQLQIPSSPSPSLPSHNNPTANTARTSSWAITKHILRTSGVRGLFHGGTVTALRDSIGYGFYFWGYELCSRLAFPPTPSHPDTGSGGEGGGGGGGGILSSDAARVLLCGGLAGIITWASIFPLDVIKTRVQTQTQLLHSYPSSTAAAAAAGEQTALLGQNPTTTTTNQSATKSQPPPKPPGAWQVAKETYQQGGVRPFFRGLLWAVYEWIMTELGQGRERTRGEVVGEEGCGFE
ncbi:hypothetical protein NEMBOFW57_010542 [Staphylotrichum longicolle]|uniref:Mitochondrial carrier protein n=1 Tax=Staphylotrichum longicolle TaxID=669026 RepID=A0AAD4HT28_9PEZI|nr:hypothetical protein NEMBOFW57_010542 [Staphylotrichum longicolle]